jgi:GNAT superfamily N-acetyltransferase
VRSCTADDVGSLAAIHARAVALAYAGIFDAGTPPPTTDQLVGRWATLLATPRAWVGVAEREGAPVGMVGVRPSPDSDAPEGAGEIVGLHVDPPWWSGGIGGALFDEAVETAHRLGFGPLRLWALEANVRARRLYERRGWQLDGATKTVAPSVLERRYSLA